MQNKRKRQMKRSSCCLRPANCESKHLNAHSCNGFCYEVPSTTTRCRLTWATSKSAQKWLEVHQQNQARNAQQCTWHVFRTLVVRRLLTQGAAGHQYSQSPKNLNLNQDTASTHPLCSCLPSESVHDFFVFSFSLKQSDESNPGKHRAFTSSIPGEPTASPPFNNLYVNALQLLIKWPWDRRPPYIMVSLGHTWNPRPVLSTQAVLFDVETRLSEPSFHIHSHWSPVANTGHFNIKFSRKKRS